MRFLLSNKLTVAACLISICLIIFSRCIDKTPATVITDNNGKAFAGSEKCKDCHAAMYDSFSLTAHNVTSQPPDSKTILGSFAAKQNTFIYSYYNWLAMLHTDSGFYQVLYNQNSEVNRYRIDMVIGSGERGQSYASWQQGRFIQLPLSYFKSTGTWVNSPGFSILTPSFNRIVNSRCLECHATYVKDTAADKLTSKIDRSQVIYGIQCERCHGPSAAHVLYHEQHPEEKKPVSVFHLAGMSRQQSVDLCAYCHGGMRQDNKLAFTYMHGDTLNHAINVNAGKQELDVHGNQYGLLAASKCYTVSQTMQCATCHNPHTRQRNQPAMFSNHCMSCHGENTDHFCTMKELPVAVLKTNCIDCHMPVKESKMLTMEEEGNRKGTPAILRSHYIAIYPEETQKYLSLIKGD